jgi:hypothetical protein
MTNVRILPLGPFDNYRAGSLGDGRYVTLRPGTTGSISIPEPLHMQDFVLFIPDGFPQNDQVRGYYMTPSTFEPWQGDPNPCKVFRYNSNGEQVMEPENESIPEVEFSLQTKAGSHHE